MNVSLFTFRPEHHEVGQAVNEPGTSPSDSELDYKNNPEVAAQDTLAITFSSPFHAFDASFCLVLLSASLTRFKTCDKVVECERDHQWSTEHQ